MGKLYLEPETHAKLQEDLDNLHAAKDALVESLRNEASEQRSIYEEAEEAGELGGEDEAGQQYDWIERLEEIANEIDGHFATMIPVDPESMEEG